MPCYPSCKYCHNKSEDKLHHLCQSCNEENSYSILEKNKTNNMSCYPECKYNFYFDKNNFDYICTNTSSCPPLYPLFLGNTKQCIENCNDKNIYKFRQACFEEYPEETKNCTDVGDYFTCNASCPFQRPFEMVKTQYCVSSCTIMERYEKLCITNCDDDRKSEIQNMVLEDFQNDIIDTFDYHIINESHNIIHKEKDVIYEITSTNCKYQDPRTTTIDLGECETELKSYYGLDENSTLYILKVDAYVEGKTGPKVEYAVYYPFDGIYLHLLDISICEGKEIFIGYSANISINELDLYNTSSNYFSDICYTFTNSKGTDMTLYDRKDDYMSNNKSYCEENCKISGYDEVKRRLICSCGAKITLSMISDIKVDKNNLYKFINLKQIINFDVMKCMKLLFSHEGLKNNIGFYSFFPIIIIYIITLFIFYLKEFKEIMNKINEIIAVKKLIKYSTEGLNQKKDNLGFFFNFLDKKRIYYVKNNKKDILKQKQNFEIDNDIKILSKKNRNEIIEAPTSSTKREIIPKKKNYYNNEKEENSKNINESEDKSNAITNLSKLKISEFIKQKYSENSSNKLNKRNCQKNDSKERRKFEQKFILAINKVNTNLLSKKEIIKIVDVLKYNDNELNDFGYKMAFKFDQRDIYQYYISLLFTKLIIFQIFNKKDYNSISLKILLFFFSFSSSYAVNALFFNDDTMHQIYEDEGDFNFIYQLPQIIYSTLLSFFIDSITSYLALSEDNIIELKKDKNLKNLNQQCRHIKDTLKIKFIFFFIVNIIFILLFWYYLGCFCAVYKNTQFLFLKDTLISVFTGYITPLGTNILTAFIRINSLKKYTKLNRMLFKMSKFLQQYL